MRMGAVRSTGERALGMPVEPGLKAATAFINNTADTSSRAIERYAHGCQGSSQVLRKKVDSSVSGTSVMWIVRISGTNTHASLSNLCTMVRHVVWKILEAGTTK